jgi:hypothetical protein
MKNLDFCCELDRELSSWRNKLHEVSEKFDHERSINKYKVQPHIEGIHILQAELDDRLDELRQECFSSESSLKKKSSLPDDEVFNYFECGCC